MSWYACKPTEHTWEPIQDWFGRYECATCEVIAYRAAVITNVQQMHPGAIIPYSCIRKDCDGPTTEKNKACPACKGSS